MPSDSPALENPPRSLIARRKAEVEYELVRDALTQTGTVLGAARLLHCDRATIYAVAAKHGIPVARRAPQAAATP